MKAADIKLGDWVYVVEDPKLDYYGSSDQFKVVQINNVQVLDVDDVHFTGQHRNWCGNRFHSREFYFSDYNCEPHRNSAKANHQVFATIEEAVEFVGTYVNQYPYMILRVVTKQPEDEWYITYKDGTVKRAKRQE